MDKIHIKIGYVQQTNSTISQIQSQISSLENELSYLKNQVDWRIQSRNGISGRLRDAEHSLVDIEHDLKKLYAFIDQSMNQYSLAEYKVIKEGNKVSFERKKEQRRDNLLSAIKDSTKTIGSFIGTLDSNRLLRYSDDLRFKFVRTGGTISLKLDKARIDRPRDYIRYRDQLSRAFEGESGDFKKRYVTRMINDGIPLYDTKHQTYIPSNVNRFIKGDFNGLHKQIEYLDSSPIKQTSVTAGRAFVGELKVWESFKDWKNATNITKISKGAGIFGIGTTIFENGNEAFFSKESKYMSDGDKIREFTVDTAVDLGTSGASMAIGASIGSLILPPAGTIVGAGLGVGINALINIKVPPNDQSIVDVTKDFANKAVDSVVDAAGDFIGDVGKKLDKVFW
ncbi:hypothetical protein KO561_18865 [Radiobacillus kanasensis]|uniref:hypothetical protein n=1 Tax=Radiobacillus kanasensis TaxID=2844358 RepID=UPI001E40F8B7|nr:hypothetical protein [Radiobacillus kanasensis]UFT99212.1 hypothetical protein KO561_18865 [Radiobacillus kanasensis]